MSKAGTCDGAAFEARSTLGVEEGIGHLVKRIALSLASECDRRLWVHGVTSTQCGALLQLQRGGRATVGALARALATDAGAMTRMLNRLERKQMIVRVRAGEDRRVVYIELSPQGEAVIADTQAAPTDALEVHLAGFTQTECQVLKSYLVRMRINGEAMRQSGDRAPDRANAALPVVVNERPSSGLSEPAGGSHCGRGDPPPVDE